MACETIKMEISANPDFVSIIRLTTSGIANKIGFSIDDIEDMKVEIRNLIEPLAINGEIHNKTVDKVAWVSWSVK